MKHPHASGGADCGSSTRHYAGTLPILASAILLISCTGAENTQGGGPTAPGTGTATLAWGGETGTNLSGSRIYYGIAPGTYLQSFGQGLNVDNVTTYTVTGLGSAVRYYFAVTAYDTMGNESGYSNEVFKDIP